VSQFYDSLDSGDSSSARAINETSQLRSDVVSMSDWIFVIMFFGFWLFLWISSFFVESHPIFLGVGFLVMIISVVIGAVVSNTYFEAVSGMTSFLSALGDPNDFSPLTVFIMKNLPGINLVMGSIMLIILYGTPGGDGL